MGSKNPEFQSLKNLKSVLATRQSSKQKNASGTRSTRPPSAGGAKNGHGNMNLSNQRLAKQRKDSGHRNKAMAQSIDLGTQGMMKRPPSNSSKTSKNSGHGTKKPPANAHT